jgi:nitrogen regulatory protein PII
MAITGFRISTPLSESKALTAAPLTGADGADYGRKFTGVTLIKSGLGNSRDRNYYPPETLERAVREGRFNKLRAYIDHPDSVSEEIQPERTVRDWAGVYTNPRYNPERKTVEADLTVFRSHKWLADTVEDLQKMGHGDMIGLSINGRGKTEPARRRLEEAGGEEVDVNEVSDFLELRSTDIVTEAGAGGGFVADMLESARRGALGETTMAAKTGKKKATAPVDRHEDEEQDDLAEAAEDVKDAAIERLAANAADTAEPIDDGDEDEEFDDEDEEDEEVTEADADDEDEDDEVTEEANSGSSTPAFLTAAQRQREQMRRSKKMAEAKRKIIGATGTTGTVNKKNTSFNKPDRGRGSKKKVRTTKTMGFRTGLKPGANVNVSESASDGRALLRENAALSRENQTLRSRNAKLAEALQTHRSADHAQRLLESSDIPVRLHPGYLRQMIGMDERAMNAFIDSKLTEIDAVAEAVGTRIEGAGSSLRESYYGGGQARGSSLGDAFAGIPTKQRS